MRRGRQPRVAHTLNPLPPRGLRPHTAAPHTVTPARRFGSLPFVLSIFTILTCVFPGMATCRLETPAPMQPGGLNFETELHGVLSAGVDRLPGPLQTALVDEAILAADSLCAARTRGTLCDDVTSPSPAATGAARRAHRSRLTAGLGLSLGTDVSLPAPSDCLGAVLKSENTEQIDSRLIVLPYDPALVRVAGSTEHCVELEPRLEGEALSYALNALDLVLSDDPPPRRGGL